MYELEKDVLLELSLQPAVALACRKSASQMLHFLCQLRENVQSDARAKEKACCAWR